MNPIAVSELGTDYNRPLDIGHSTRLPTRAGVHTSTVISTPRVAFESSGVQFNREGNREVEARLGGSVWQHYYQGSVVTRGTMHAHKLSGVAGGFLGGENICQRQGEPEHSTLDGQHNSNLICESNGGTHSYNLLAIARSLWQWCLQRSSAEYLPGTLNAWADAESRTLPSSAEWKLQGSICHRVLGLLGPCQIDLLITRLNHQLPEYVSWRPDPHAVAADAFEMRWVDFQGYANPPFSLVGSKVIQEGCTIVLVAPVWPEGKRKGGREGKSLAR